MSKLPKSLLLQLNNVNIRNNWIYPSREFLTSLGITFHEFVFFKWKKHREFQSMQYSKIYIKNSKNTKQPEWGGGMKRRG